MIQSSLLVDYMRIDEPHDLHHSLFPDCSHEHMQAMWDELADRIVMDLQVKVKSHIDTLYIPDMHEPLTASVFPPDMHLYLAMKIDENIPDWNICQKTLAFSVYIHELYNQARNDLFNRIRDKHNRKMEEQIKISPHLKNLFDSGGPPTELSE